MTSTIKVDNIQNQCGANIIKECGQHNYTWCKWRYYYFSIRCITTGFGRTGTVDWHTTSKTATFTAASGEGYFVILHQWSYYSNSTMQVQQVQ